MLLCPWKVTPYGSTKMLYFNERITYIKKKKNPAQLNCFVHSSVKTSYEKELVSSKGSLAGGKQAQDGKDINSSPGPEAGALGLVLESRVQPVLVWCKSARGGQDVLRQRRRNHSSLRLKVSLFLQHTRSRLPCSLHSKWPPSSTSARFLLLSL